jgi:TRAP-type transport system small permease protein
MKQAQSAFGRGFTQLIEAVLASMLAVMAVLVFGNVVLRYGFNSGITASEELSRFLFVWLTFIGAILAFKEGAHLGVDTLVQRLPGVWKRVLYGASALLMLLCCGVLLKGSWAQTVINLQVPAPVTGIPMAALYGIGIVAAVCMGAMILSKLFKLLTGKLTDSDLAQVSDSEEEHPERYK